MSVGRTPSSDPHTLDMRKANPTQAEKEEVRYPHQRNSRTVSDSCLGAPQDRGVAIGEHRDESCLKSELSKPMHRLMAEVCPNWTKHYEWRNDWEHIDGNMKSHFLSRSASTYHKFRFCIVLR